MTPENSGDLESLQGKRVDVTPLFEATGIPADAPIEIIETEGMYPYKNRIPDNWAYYTAVGCKHFRDVLASEGRPAKSVGIIGICSGVEGIVVTNLFKPEHLIVTDVDDGILDGTMVNIANAAQKHGIKTTRACGSFCEPIAAIGHTVDFVHGNIPNLPADQTRDLRMGDQKGTFLRPALYDQYNPPEEFKEYALAAQWAYLQSARPILNNGGSVITELGGRMPLSLVKELFSRSGYGMQELLVGFKEQTEAQIDFEGYHELEKEYGVKFEFYIFQMAMSVLDSLGIHNQTAIPDQNINGEKLKDSLAPFKVSAGQALLLHQLGVRIGHTVHLFRGIKLGE